MTKNKKAGWFNWPSNKWTMGEILVQKYSNDNDGNKILKLEILVPKKIKFIGSHLKKLLAKDYKSVLVTPDKGNTDFLQLSFTDIEPPNNVREKNLLV